MYSAIIYVGKNEKWWEELSCSQSKVETSGLGDQVKEIQTKNTKKDIERKARLSKEGERRAFV